MINYHLTGLRVTVETEGGTVYGVARVRYTDWHTHVGHYEIERADGTSFLAPFAACEAAPNWDLTPAEGQFTGAEIFRPAFLDDTRHRFLSYGCGVLIPGDMDRLRGLVGSVRPGDAVKWESHGCNEFVGSFAIDTMEPGRVRVRDPKPRPGVRAPAPGGFSWPVEGDDFDVNGDRLDFVRVPPKRTGKHRGKSLSLTFSRTVRY